MDYRMFYNFQVPEIVLSLLLVWCLCHLYTFILSVDDLVSLNVPFITDEEIIGPVDVFSFGHTGRPGLFVNGRQTG